MRTCVKKLILPVLALTALGCVSDAVSERSCRHGDVCACEACAKDPIFGR